MKNIKELMKELYTKIEEFDLLEHVKCISPSYSYPRIYRDTLTGYSNSESLVKDLNRLSKYDQSLAIYTADVAGLKYTNEKHSHHIGNLLIILGSRILKKAVSDYNGKVYRVYGDDYVVIVEGISEEDAEKIPHTISNLCETIDNDRRGSFEDVSVADIPMEIPIHLHVGFTYSSHRGNRYVDLDNARKATNRKKIEFYTEYPELDMRNKRNNHHLINKL